MSGTSMAANPKLVAKPASPQLMQLDFKAIVNVDGTLGDIQPDASLPAAIQVMMRKRIATWHYKPSHWQGKSLTGTIAQTIKAIAVPTTQGGFALRIEEVTEQSRSGESLKKFFASHPPPEIPTDVNQRGVRAILVYAVLFDEAGKAVQVDLVYPTEPDRDARLLDKSARNAIAKWATLNEFDGVPISCRAKVPIAFEVSSMSSAPFRVPASAPLREPPEVSASFDKYTDMCPVTKIETVVKDTFL